ncbi:MAG: hypothetical protein FJ295_01815 [Planctomycetes bacterium]|nr:hypothetical protein [Planctomycetota bacterium]
MTEQVAFNFERLPGDGPLDETDVSLRAYFARLTDEHLAGYYPAWPDERVIEWDGNFRSDGVLMLTCCERDVDVSEYRQVLEKHLAYRKENSTRDDST